MRPSRILQRRRLGRGERGAALLLVSIILVIVLVGGLAAVAVTSGEIASSRGYRTRQVTNAAAAATLERMRATLTGDVDDATLNAITTTFDVGGATLSCQIGHYSGGTGYLNLPPEAYDAFGTVAGSNITNQVGPKGGLVSVKRGTAVCEGPGFGAREMELVFQYAGQ